MFKKFFLTSSLLISIFFAATYPTKGKNIELFNYCFALETILTKNAINSKNYISGNVKSISKDIVKIGVNKTRGTLINSIINQYKTSKNMPIISSLPNNIYCFFGFWIEKIKPGTFESIFYKKTRNSFIEFKDQVNLFIDDIDLEYNNIKKELNNLFN